MVWDWRVSRAGPMPFCWPSCSLIFCLQLFSHSFLFLYRLVVWGWGLRTDRVSISISRPCIANLFNYNNNNIGFLVYNYYYFLLYTRFHSSPVKHENFRSKVVLMGNSAKKRLISILKCAKNKISNKCYFHLPKSRFVGKRKINIK